MICHKDFQRMMLDAEIYVDRIADMRITDMNAVMEAVRQSVIKKKGNDQEDLYLRTLELAQVQEDEYFGHVVSKDLTSILRDIRDTHRKDATTADENCAALDVQKQLQDAMDFKGSTEDLTHDARHGPGVFELYPTKNMYQFILLDKANGRTWHVQWGLEDEHRWIRRIK